MTDAPSLPPVGFVNIETTGLHPRQHEVYEVGLLRPQEDGSWARLRWYLPVDLSIADPIALDVGKFHDRHPQGYNSLTDESELTSLRDFAAEFAHVTYGLHLVAAMPHFDMPRLLDIVLDAGLINGWNYHCICIESMMLGYLAAIEDNGTMKPGMISFPWKSADLYKAMGLDLSKYLVHTALGDCDLAKAAWDIIFPSEIKTPDPTEYLYTLESSVILFMSYNKDTCDLRVDFKSGGSWVYQDVPRWIWMEGQKAESKGGWYTNMIKGKFISYRYGNEAPVTKDGVTQWASSQMPCDEHFGDGVTGTTLLCIRAQGHPPISQDMIGHSNMPHLRGR